MKPIIIKPVSAVLSRYVQYFLFISSNSGGPENYTTFPNNNLCLAVYKQQSIAYLNTPFANVCNVKNGSDVYTSRLYGFHSMPFNVNIDGGVDQICIVLHPSALRAFSHEGYNDLLESTAAFTDIFDSNTILERIFDTANFRDRSALLEGYLLTKIRYEIPVKLKEILHLISFPTTENIPSVKDLSQKTGISEPTLYRLFINYLGQSPKAYLKTVRFRKVLNRLTHVACSAIPTHYLNEFYDQSHFIKEFKAFSGYTPRRITDLISVEHNELAWVNKNPAR